MIMTLGIAVEPHKSSWTAAGADAPFHSLAMPRGASGQPRRLPGIAPLRATGPTCGSRSKAAGLGAPLTTDGTDRSNAGVPEQNPNPGAFRIRISVRKEGDELNLYKPVRAMTTQHAPVDADGAQASVAGAGAELPWSVDSLAELGARCGHGEPNGNPSNEAGGRRLS
jgi:hypothetical protein